MIFLTAVCKQEEGGKTCEMRPNVGVGPEHKEQKEVGGKDGLIDPGGGTHGG